jgi:hypothetical protein
VDGSVQHQERLLHGVCAQGRMETSANASGGG